MKKGNQNTPKFPIHRQIKNQLRYGDLRVIAEKTGFSKDYVTKTMHGLRYNKSIIDAAKELIKQRQTYMQSK